MRLGLTITLGFVVASAITAPVILQEAFTTTHVDRAQATLPKQLVLIHTRRGEIRFHVEVARTLEQQQAGLMFRRSVPALGGMIFPIQPARNISFWMKNTVIPLDMLFISADGSIARILTARAMDETPDRAGEAVAAVLEIGAGQAQAYGVSEGDRVSWQGLALP